MSRMLRDHHRLLGSLLSVLLGWASFSSFALNESFNLGGDELKLILNNTFTVGGGIRMQSPNVELIGKSNLDRNVCGVPFQSCQGVFKDQIFPAQKLVRSEEHT